MWRRKGRGHRPHAATRTPRSTGDGSGDASQLHQVLVNLLSNARKHTGPGTTVVTGVSRSADGSVTVTVTDDGGGIPPEFVDRVFARFARADVSRAVRLLSGEGAAGSGPLGPASAEGTSGLGLSIVQSIVEAHGGSVDVTSRSGRTRFTAWLPAKIIAQGDAPHS